MSRKALTSVYISDLDGTLLRGDATLSDYSYTVLCRLIDAGLKFTVASARSVVSMRPMLRGLELPLPVIEFNGAFVTDMGSDRKLVVNDLEKAILETAYEIIISFGVQPFVSTFNGESDRVYYESSINEGMNWYVHDRQVAGDPRFAVVEHVSDHFEECVVCLTAIERHSLVEQIRARVEKEIPQGVEVHVMENLYHPGWHWLTVHDAKATKASAIECMMAMVGLNGAETVCFGDHVNDLKMFGVADRCYAVSNAKEVLRREATAVIGSNEEDSVARFIEEDFEPRENMDDHE